jgi:hypothetical protein
MPIRQDYILRLIEQIGAALRRLRERLARGAPAAASVAREALDSQAELLGPLWPMLQQVDAETAASLVPDARQLRLWGELTRVESDAYRLLGDADRADRLERRAAVFARVAAARGE